MEEKAPNAQKAHAELERLRAANRALEEENALLRTARDDSQRSEKRYRLITENTLDLICEVSQHGFYTYVSPNHQEILGYHPKELLGNNFATLIHGDDVAQVVERFSECIVAGIPFVCSFRLRHKDGSWHWVEVSAKPLEAAASPGGSRYEGQAIFVYRDVTERNVTRRALSAETERLKVTLSSIADGVISTDLSGCVVEANEAALHLVGLTRETLVGASVDEHLEFIDEMSRTPVRSPVIRALTEAVPCTLPLSGHTLLRTKSGAEFAVAGAAAPIRDQEDQLVGTVLIFRNITEKRRTEQELLKLSKQESLGQLAARIAHDFNNLLTVILGNLSLTKILLAPGDAALRRLADTEKACLRAKDLTRQLLAFARGGLPVKKPLAIEPLVRESTRLILQDANVAYRLNWPEPLPQVNADAEQLHQLLYELLTNAMHATPIGGSIHVRGEAVRLNAEGTVPLPEGDYVRLSVRDEGLGIPEKHLTRIFEPFFSTKENARGLGLATCFLIARNHDGFLTVDSAPGFGTTFYLYLPALPMFIQHKASTDPEWIAPAPPRRVSTIDEFADPYAPMPIEPGAADTRRILVMDDEQPICELAAELLTREGYAVDTALDGAEAVRKYVEAQGSGRPYDVVILDLTVRGGMGGRETVLKLAEVDPGVRAIVSSGYSQDLMMSRYREFGFSGVVSKPYSISELTQEIEQAIAGSRQ
jgi:PAS domain S-box-containing protein